MSESELKEMGQKLGTKAVARFGELTARRKQAEERMQAMEQSYINSSKVMQKPLQSSKIIRCLKLRQ